MFPLLSKPVSWWQTKIYILPHPPHTHTDTPKIPPPHTHTQIQSFCIDIPPGKVIALRKSNIVKDMGAETETQTKVAVNMVAGGNSILIVQDALV